MRFGLLWLIVFVSCSLGSAQEVPLTLPPRPSPEVLARIQPAVVKPVIKTRQGYTLEFDRSKQILSVRIPKKEDSISDEIGRGNTVEVIADDVPLQESNKVLARLKKGRILFVTKEDKGLVQVAIVENGEVLRGWVPTNQLKLLAETQQPLPWLAWQPECASAAMLIQKGKQFDDGLYAAVELALQNGLDATSGKKDWLPRLAAAVKADAGGTPLAVLHAAIELSGNAPPTPAAIANLKKQALANFLADEKQSKPIGFYTWSKELAAIFQQDRILQSELDSTQNGAGILAIGKALAADTAARASYEKMLRLNERLTNKLTGAGYREVLASLDAGKTPDFKTLGQISFLPPSRSHETDLALRLFAAQPVPANFDLMTEVITRLKDGRLSFQPREDSGWYDHQLWSLESLVRYDQSPEAFRLSPDSEYLKHLEELFKGSYALMRETHIKPLRASRLGSAPGDRGPKIEREIVVVSPDPQVEMLPTMYLRRAASYRFVRGVLIEIFGQDNVAKMRRQTADGPVEMNLLAELDQMAGIFGGAYFTACRNCGLKEEANAAEIGNGKSADEQSVGFLRWVAALPSDPDTATDSRMMAPVFYDLQRKKTKVWLMLGWEGVSSLVGYARHPATKIIDADGKEPAADTGPRVVFRERECRLTAPVFAEVYVTKILNRAEFRRHCDTYQTKAAILANLE
ncbi:hypothetical protein [Anatilimnocola floriformis]|uniref:hypothetical protein n=1 Tax=Anatilimnocola floriformis TaxID=2948575 RepID=UPI0020C25589|nr:hypothetical protein [Anatilimnocola floriformis]